MKRNFVFVLFLVFSLSSLFSAPFGIELGWDSNDLKDNKISYRDYPEDTVYMIDAPFKHWAFPYYYGTYTPDGITNISAYTEELKIESKDGAELWDAYLQIFDSFCASYGLPHMLIDHYANEQLKNTPSKFMKALFDGDARIMSIWIFDNNIIFLDMYAYTESTADISCEVWGYKDAIDYINNLKKDYTVVLLSTKEDIPW